MKKIIIIVGLIFAISISVFGQTSDKNSKAKEQVMALANELTTALIKGDVTTLERILSDDYVSVSPLPIGKKFLIESFKVNANNSNIDKVTAIDFDKSEANIRLYDNVAVMVFPVKVKWSKPNNQIREKFYVTTLVAYKKKGRWQIVSTQDSEYTFQESLPRESK